MATRKTGSRTAGRPAGTQRKTSRRPAQPKSRTGAKKSGPTKRGTKGTPAAGRPSGRVGKGAPSPRSRSARGTREQTPDRKASSRIQPARKETRGTERHGRKTAPPTRALARRGSLKPRGPARSPGVRDLGPLVEDLRQEKSELMQQLGQLQAERDSALAEAGRMQQRITELEESAARHPAQEARPAGGQSFQPDIDLEDDEIGPEDDFDGTVGFFDRIEEIRARRIELDRERNDRELEQTSQPFWMICPKCGEGLDELENESIKLERCEGCGGLYLDRGEVDLLLSLVQDSDGVRRLHNVLRF